MILEILLILFIFVVYFLFYVELKINKNNTVFQYDKELTRQHLSNEILLKTPFFFNGSHLNTSVNTSNYKCVFRDKKCALKEYVIVEPEPKILKPYIKSDCSRKLYVVKKQGKINIHKNYESVNYYFVREGSMNITLIHPRFADNFHNDYDSEEVETYIKTNDYFKRIECSKGTIMFVPNDWFVFIHNYTNNVCMIEKITFSTLINKLMLYFKKNT